MTGTCHHMEKLYGSLALWLGWALEARNLEFKFQFSDLQLSEYWSLTSLMEQGSNSTSIIVVAMIKWIDI
jgi:hypothetical protein